MQKVILLLIYMSILLGNLSAQTRVPTVELSNAPTPTVKTLADIDNRTDASAPLPGELDTGEEDNPDNPSKLMILAPARDGSGNFSLISYTLQPELLRLIREHLHVPRAFASNRSSAFAANATERLHSNKKDIEYLLSKENPDVFLLTELDAEELVRSVGIKSVAGAAAFIIATGLISGSGIAGAGIVLSVAGSAFSNTANEYFFNEFLHKRNKNLTELAAEAGEKEKMSLGNSLVNGAFGAVVDVAHMTMSLANGDLPIKTAIQDIDWDELWNNARRAAMSAAVGTVFMSYALERPFPTKKMLLVTSVGSSVAVGFGQILGKVIAQSKQQKTDNQAVKEMIQWIQKRRAKAIAKKKVENVIDAAAAVRQQYDKMRKQHKRLWNLVKRAGRRHQNLIDA